MDWTGWTGERAPRQHIAVPLVDLSDAELATAAQACRAMPFQEGERARRMENQSVRGPIEAAARRYAELVIKLEAARHARSTIADRESLADCVSIR